MKLYRNDIIAILVSALVLILTALILPYGVPAVRALVGLVAGGLVFLAYIVARRPDAALELEDSLNKIAKDAQKISYIATKGEARDVQKDLVEIATYTARICTKCLSRNLTSISIQIMRLEKLTGNFVTVLDVLTGEVALPRAQMDDEIRAIKTQRIPETLETLHDLDVAIDEVAAQRYRVAESELETLHRLSDLNSKAGQAAQMLLKIIEKNPK